MEALKARAVRRFPKLRRWISTEPAAGEADRELATARSTASSGLQMLALGLNKRLAEDARRRSSDGGGGGSSSNVVFSPLSVYAALSLAAAGARGDTLEELLCVLEAPSRDGLAGPVRALAERALADRSRTGGPRVSSACGVWHDVTRRLRPAYRDAAAGSYKAETRAVDFHGKAEEAGEEINGWVAASTNNLVASMLDPSALSEQTDLVLATAVYFNGKWADEPFDKQETNEDKFHRLDGGGAVDVPFMRGRGRQRVACHDGFKVLQLRYESGRRRDQPPAPAEALYSMCIFLPDTGNGLWRLIDRMACTPGCVTKYLPTSAVPVGDFRLPRFKLDFSRGMAGILRTVGLREIFEQEKANLSDMAVELGRYRTVLALQEVFHSAVIEVDEEAAEAAAAATCCVMEGCYRRPPVPVDFVADHPFAFFVIEEVTGAVILAGHVLDPSS